MTRCFTMFVFLVSAHRVMAEAPKAEYPLKIGSKWTYLISGKKKELVNEAVRGVRINNLEGIVIESTMDGKVVASEVLAVDKGTLLRLKISDLDIDPPLKIWEFNAPVGRAWSAAYRVPVEGKPVESKIDYLVSIEKVKVPAGEYDTKVVTGTMKTGKTVFWLAKNVGPVKMEFDLGGGNTSSLELKKFESGK